MEHINFLEPRRFHWKQTELNYLSMVILFGLFAFFTLSYGVIQRIRMHRLQNEIFISSEQIKHLSSIVTTSPNTIITAPQGLLWSPLIYEIAEKKSASVILKNLKGSLLGERKLELEGIASRLADVAQLKEKMEKSKYFQEVLLTSSKEVDADKGKKKMAFTLEANLR